MNDHNKLKEGFVRFFGYPCRKGFRINAKTIQAGAYFFSRLKEGMTFMVYVRAQDFAKEELGRRPTAQLKPLKEFRRKMRPKPGNQLLQRRPVEGWFRFRSTTSWLSCFLQEM